MISRTSPTFETHLSPPLSDAEKNRQAAMIMLDNMNDYGMSRDGLISELKFEFGYSDKEAQALYWEWLRIE